MLGVPMNCLRKMETDPLCSRSLPQYALSLSLTHTHTHTHTLGGLHTVAELGILRGGRLNILK